ncbi:MAG: hypothetical protein ACR2RV_15500 [Verrucomicrobiales bacterium]
MRLRNVILAAALLSAAIPTHVLQAQGTQDAKKPSAGAVNYNDLYKEAVADYKAGRNREAEMKFRKVLSRYPEHVQSQRYRALIRNRMRELAAIPAMKRRLSQLTMEEIAFEDATLAEVMEFVVRKAKELSDGKVSPGLVIRGGDAVRERKLSFKTGAVPIDTLVDAAARLTNTKVQYNDYALTFTPLPTAAERNAEAAAKLEQAEAQERARAAAEAEREDPFRNR